MGRRRPPRSRGCTCGNEPPAARRSCTGGSSSNIRRFKMKSNCHQNACMVYPSFFKIKPKSKKLNHNLLSFFFFLKKMFPQSSPENGPSKKTIVPFFFISGHIDILHSVTLFHAKLSRKGDPSEFRAAGRHHKSQHICAIFRLGKRATQQRFDLLLLPRNERYKDSS